MKPGCEDRLVRLPWSGRSRVWAWAVRWAAPGTDENAVPVYPDDLVRYRERVPGCGERRRPAPRAPTRRFWRLPRRPRGQCPRRPPRGRNGNARWRPRSMRSGAPRRGHRSDFVRKPLMTPRSLASGFVARADGLPLRTRPMLAVTSGSRSSSLRAPSLVGCQRHGTSVRASRPGPGSCAAGLRSRRDQGDPGTVDRN